MNTVFALLFAAIALFLLFIWRALEAIAETLWILAREVDTRRITYDPRDP